MPKPTFLLLLAVCVIFAGCRSHTPQYVTINDATREQILTLTRLGSHPGPSSIRLRITGKIDGAATLIVLRETRPYKTLELTAGPIDTEWHDDWQSNQLSLHYLPGTVKTGGLQIAYVFSD
jgi:hypothetical protein